MDRAEFILRNPEFAGVPWWLLQEAIASVELDKSEASTRAIGKTHYDKRDER